MSVLPSCQEIVEELIRLHERKDRHYRDAWRKRGELIGIFCNIARKYDRLVVARDEEDPDKGEPRADTAADLCIYSIKYVTWLIERDPAAANAVGAANGERWSGVHGHDAVAEALGQLAVEAQASDPQSVAAAFDAVQRPFASLEQILVGGEPVSNATKAALAWQLSGAALAYLRRLALDDPHSWKRFTAYTSDRV